MLKAIETRYAGRRFRSRREARWAILFDELEIDWRYEPEGYVLAGNVHYLPDFELHYVTHGTPTRCWVEVKPDLQPYSQLSSLCSESEQCGWLVAEPMLRADALCCDPTGRWWPPKPIARFLFEVSGLDAADPQADLRLVAASNAALSARWEHGEQPRRKPKPGGRGPRAYTRPEQLFNEHRHDGGAFTKF